MRYSLSSLQPEYKNIDWQTLFTSHIIFIWSKSKVSTDKICHIWAHKNVHKILEIYLHCIFFWMYRGSHKKCVLFEYFTKSVQWSTDWEFMTWWNNVGKMLLRSFFKGEFKWKKCVCQCMTLKRTHKYECLQYMSKWVTYKWMSASVLCVHACSCEYSLHSQTNAAATSLATSSDSNLDVGSEEWN